MTLSTSRLSYSDCYEVFDRALEDPLGVRIPCRSLDIATMFRMRLHQARAIDRADNAKTYAPDEMMHGRSAYDEIRVMIRQHDGGTYLYLVKIQTPKAIEPLSQLEALNGPNNGSLLEHMGPSVDGGDRPDPPNGRPERVAERPLQGPRITRR